MKALTVCQPYAEQIASGEKVLENRDWATAYRGPLVIHAGKSKAWLDDPRDAGLFVFGAAVAIVDLVDCVRWEALPEDEKARHDAHGPYCWRLANVRRLPEPIPLRGALGLWEADIDQTRERG